jgi:hypothetical protein
MPGTWFRRKSAQCGRMAQDATRTEADRDESKHQEMLWLKIAEDAEANDDARRLHLALRGAADK